MDSTKDGFVSVTWSVSPGDWEASRSVKQRNYFVSLVVGELLVEVDRLRLRDFSR